MHHLHTRPPAHAAFTLVEVAIVLVIIGLLIGGIMTGQTLIRQSQLSGVTKEIGTYTNAVNLFKLEFKALPGDFAKATDYWGVADDNQVACATTPSTGQITTCNGNGDGRINGEGYASPDGVIPSRFETYRAWQHLANAKLIDGSYSGIVGPAHTVRASVPETNVPPGKVSGSSFDFYYIGAISNNANGNFFSGSYGNLLIFGNSLGGTDISIRPALMPEEAQSIDQKLDDGMPGTGALLVPKNGSMWTNTCSTTDDPADSVYNLANETRQCALLRILQ